MSGGGKSPVWAGRIGALVGGGDEGDGGVSRYRALWAESVVQVLDDYWDQHRKARSPEAAGKVLQDAGRYYRSRDGRDCLSMAGIEPSERTVAGLLAIITHPDRPKKQMVGGRERDGGDDE